jgi:hypothetical protein
MDTPASDTHSGCERFPVYSTSIHFFLTVPDCGAGVAWRGSSGNSVGDFPPPPSPQRENQSPNAFAAPNRPIPCPAQNLRRTARTARRATYWGPARHPFREAVPQAPTAPSALAGPVPPRPSFRRGPLPRAGRLHPWNPGSSRAGRAAPQTPGRSGFFLPRRANFRHPINRVSSRACGMPVRLTAAARILKRSAPAQGSTRECLVPYSRAGLEYGSKAGNRTPNLGKGRDG